MKTSAFTLLPATQFGTESENYDGIATSFSGVPVKAADYYSRCKGLQTVSWFLNDLVGTITIEGTLDDDPETGRYMAIAPVVGDPVVPVTESDMLNIRGNYT